MTYTIRIPKGSEFTHFDAAGGRQYQPVMLDGQLVVEISEYDLRCLLRCELGQRLALANPDVIAKLAMSSFMIPLLARCRF